MSILLLGANGQVGWELQRALAPLGPVTAWDRQRADFNQLERLDDSIMSLRPRVIVNAAAYTAVDQAERDAAQAQRINADAVAVLAGAAQKLGAWLVHYSTDYVFDGSQEQPYAEQDIPRPLNVYGRTKHAGEQAIQTSGCRYLILRTSWVYALRGSNFIKTMLRLAAERDTLHVVADQLGAPTSAELIADTTALVLQRLRHDPELATGCDGIYHLVASGHTSWHEYAQFIIRRAAELGLPLKLTPERILPIGSDEYPTPASRPANSRLYNQKIQKTFGLQLSEWHVHVERLLQEWATIGRQASLCECLSETQR